MQLFLSFQGSKFSNHEQNPRLKKGMLKRLLLSRQNFFVFGPSEAWISKTKNHTVFFILIVTGKENVQAIRYFSQVSNDDKDNRDKSYVVENQLIACLFSLTRK